MEVSKVFRFQSFEEYPKNWINNLIVQNIPKPKVIFFPRLVSKSSLADVKQSKPIRKTVSAIKNV